MKEGLFHLVYFTFLHNQLAIGFAILAIISLVALIKQPKRNFIFFFIGFLLLLFQFEYEKHIVGDLAEQTVNTVFIEEGNYRARWATNVALYHLAPLILWLAGWGSVALGVLITGFSRPKSPAVDKNSNLV